MAIDIMIAPYGANRQGVAYPPNPTQQKVLDWIDNQKHLQLKNPDSVKSIPVLCLQGGVGSGKSRAFLAGVVELLNEIPNIRILWGRSDFKDLKLSIMDKFFEIMPMELIKNKSEQYHWYDIVQSGGTRGRIYFNGLKDLSGLGSQEFAVIVVTEAHEISEQMYRALKRRCRQEKSVIMILMETEPPNEGHWLDNFTNPEHKDYDSDIEKWTLSTYENWNNLPLAYRGSLEKMPESWKKKYLLGQLGFIPSGKPYYQGFVERIHKKDLQYIPGRPVIRAWDYGFYHPAVTYHQIDAKGRWLILKEVLGTEITIDKFGNYIKTMDKEWFPNAEFDDVGDPAGAQKSDKSEKTSVEILASLGIHVTSKQSTYRERKEIIERKLATLIDGIPALVVDSSCKLTIDGFLGGYHYPVRRPGEAFDPRRFELPFRDGLYEHLLNTVEYFAVNTFTGAETKVDRVEPSVRVVGDLKDIKFDVEEDLSYSDKYLEAIGYR